MPMRSRDWNEGLAERLKDLDYASEYLLALIEEGEPLQGALAKTIRGYGVREYSELTELNESAIQRAIDTQHNPTKSTLEKILVPLGLNLGVQRSGGAA